MATIIRGSVLADEFALHHTLKTLTDGTFEVERIVETGTKSVMPLVWISNVDGEALMEAIAADPSVNEASLLASFENDFLYRMEWIDRVHLLVQMITSSKATVLDAFGRKDQWHLRVLYPDRGSLSATHEFCEDQGLTFEVEAIREMEGEPAGRFGLTDDQYRALVAAARHGYFEVPQGITLEELAEEFDVSHQALSERIHRGMSALVEDTLMFGADLDEGTSG